MRHDLMTIQIKIDPGRRAAAFAATQHPGIKLPGERQIMHRKSQMKRSQHVIPLTILPGNVDPGFLCPPVKLGRASGAAHHFIKHALGLFQLLLRLE
jgi:hypothetical protein